MKLEELAKRIDLHLNRFEKDPSINIVSARYRTSLYWQAGAWSAGRYVQIRYIGYQSHLSLTKSEALTYLDWLDKGNIGKYWDMLNEKKDSNK